jgi:hypothetical protein
MPRLKKDNDVSPPSREGEVIEIDDDDDDEEEAQPPPSKYAATYGASFSSLLFNNNDGLQTLPPGWKMTLGVIRSADTVEIGTICATAIIICVTTGKQLDSCHSLCHHRVLQRGSSHF